MTEIVICNMAMFGNDNRHFWLSDLSDLLVKYPMLELPHRHDFFMLLFVESADGMIDVDGEWIRLDKPKVVIVRPHCVCELKLNREAKGKFICFTEDFFSTRYNDNILQGFSIFQASNRPFIRLSHEQFNRFSTLIAFTQHEFQMQKRETKKVLRSYLNILLFEVERLHQPVKMPTPGNFKREKIHQFELLIEKHFESKKLPSDYSELLNMSANYLNKICKEETGKTAGEIIRGRIMLEAQRLLHYTSYSVNEIAEKLGFDSTPYFITFFKKQTQLSPEKYRKLQVNQ
jgi:AraC family transcriptional activator of pobA